MYGLLGRKLGHSLSPQIHAKFGDYPYELFCREPDEIDSFFADEKVKAFNVTIPYKIEAYKRCDILSETAKNIGSVNTVVKKNGKIYGYNTDFFGFSYMSKKFGADYKNKKVLILGSGGASLTVQKVAKHFGAENIVVVSRSGEDNYENISKHYDSQIIVNSTPVGMFPENGKRLIDLSCFKNCECVLDLIYNPCKTQLILDAEKLDIPCGSGMAMLVAQGLQSAELFFDRKFEDDIIERVYSQMMFEQNNIVLIGMPGCGKSTVSKILSQRLARTAVDIDDEIVKIDCRSIPQIFSESGEEYFRNIETEATRMVGKNIGQIIATGGGCVMREENRDALAQNGIFVYLKKDISLLSTENRPLSNGKNAVEQIYNKRKSTYEALADFTVEVDEDAEKTTESVIKCISL